jgi:tetratricopeptide (TPR) repeat protein
MRNRMFDADTLLFYVLHPDSLAARDSVRALADSLDRVARNEKLAQSEEQRLRERLARRRPHGRNTGRVTPLELDQQAAAAQQTASASGTAAAGGTQPPYRKVNLRAVPPDSVLQVLSALRIEMGWLFFDKIGNVDSALFYYRLALDGKLPDSLRANAYYTLAGMGRQLGDTAMTREYEDRLIDELPNTRYALGIMAARGMELPKDTATVAREAYDRAARLLEQGRYREGIAAMETMAASYPNTEQAIRARLAIAMTYELSLDSGRKALELYRALVRDYPTSRYSQRGRDIFAAMDAAVANAEKKKAEEQRKAEEAQKQKEREELERQKKEQKPERRRLLLEDQREIDSIRATQKKKADPTQDSDFPLNLPGENKPKQPPQQPGEQPGQPPQGKDAGQKPPEQNDVPMTPLEPPPTPMSGPPPGKGK